MLFNDETAGAPEPLNTPPPPPAISASSTAERNVGIPTVCTISAQDLP